MHSVFPTTPDALTEGWLSDVLGHDVAAFEIERFAAGVGVIAAGGWIGVRAAMRSYHKHLRLGEMSRRTRRLVDVTGVVGGVARGLLFAAVGVFAVRAAIEYEPDKAKGLDDTLRSFADSPAGPALLACVAVGLVLFGLFSFAMARWRKV